jgi:galactofuranosylgalactofuranosylrhamnosyl-N-acetylglucosaminyl-diphospho-decaprenol beta-1,5/1,6-galactofuranosyltransferase
LPSGTRELLAKARFAGAKQEICLAAPRAQNSTGLLYFELQSHSDRTALHSADWVARDVTPREVKLAIGYCSFDREDELLHNVQTLVKERKLDDLLSQIVVVDQGTRKVHDHRRYKETVERANGRLSVIEQLNLGGAGGFTRCILEVCKDPSVTHILLTDDDAIIDSESVLRTARFLALCKADVAVAGHLLDRQNPAELVEVGGSYDTTVAAMSPARHRRANRASELRELASARENQTGGWWYFAFPLKKVQQVGLPLPLFLRGDDAEYGCRLSQSGVRIIPLPGIAVRHEAIDRTRRGWQEYYDVRNMLILGAIHFEVSQRTIIRRFTGELLGALFTFQYERAALHCLAIADYLRGPGLVCRPADAIHEAVLGARRRLMPTSQAADDSTGSRASTSQCLQGGFLRAMRLLVRNLLLPSPLPNARPSYVIDKTACKWRSLGTEDVFAVAEETSNSWIVYRRSRARFVELLVSGTWLAVRLLLRHRTTRRSWRDGARALTTHSFWLRFTGMESKAITPR